MAIKALISVKRLVAEVSLASAPLKVGIQYQLAEASEIYLDPDSKNRWLYEEVPTSEVVINVFSTTKADAITVDETIGVSADLPKFDQVTNSDTFSRQVTFLRTPVEPKTAVDVLQQVFTKPRADTFAVGDVSSPTANKNITETVYGNQEGPNFISDYVDSSYFAATYTSRGIPKFDFDKSLADTATFTELPVFTLNKPLIDTAAFSDAITGVDYDKSVTDSVNATDDFYGVANLDDDQIMSFITSRSEITSVAELVTAQTEKELGESLSTSDSGSLRMTDFCDVNYFADSYIGTSATF